jgi:hypothetical protein
MPRIDPARGQLIAAGAIALTVAVFLTEIRFDEEWSAGARLLLSGLSALGLLAIARFAPRAPDEPAPWVSAVLVCAFILTFGALADLADALGSEGGVSTSGTVTWIGALLTALFGRLAVQRDSAICTLLAALTAIVTVLAFADWAFGLDDPTKTFRWLLLVLTVALLAAAVSQLDARRHHGVALADAAGLAVLGIAGTVAVDSFARLFSGGGAIGIGWGWELAVLATGAALAAVAVTRRVPGPGYLAALDLFAFGLMTSATTDDASLLGWPLVLFAVAAILLVAALRPPPPAVPDRMEVTVR